MVKKNKGAKSKGKESLKSKEEVDSIVAYRNYYPNDKEV
ncbi:Uncharacterised protein [Clostridium disporicum]|uniref:Uncharacterized protein n=1 Tax=Clostridium disporicum TaxID=84024 RepID=A0A173Z1T5_9CLOT|nr:Uncharacterised protein [Clostridium disporicum]